MLANARKLDRDLSAVVEGGLASLAIGRYLQRLRQAEQREGVSPAAADAIRKTTLRLAAVNRRPGEMLAVLEEVSQMLSRAVEIPREGGDVVVLAAASAT